MAKVKRHIINQIEEVTEWLIRGGAKKKQSAQVQHMLKKAKHEFWDNIEDIKHGGNKFATEVKNAIDFILKQPTPDIDFARDLKSSANNLLHQIDNTLEHKKSILENVVKSLTKLKIALHSGIKKLTNLLSPKTPVDLEQTKIFTPKGVAHLKSREAAFKSFESKQRERDPIRHLTILPGGGRGK